MNAGERTNLMQHFARFLNLQSRIVNFYNVPVQVGHTAIEIFIDDEWRFFDPSFGIYFTLVNSNIPIALSTARELYPNVLVKKFTGSLRYKALFDLKKHFVYETLKLNDQNLLYYPG